MDFCDGCGMPDAVEELRKINGSLFCPECERDEKKAKNKRKKEAKNATV